MKLRPFELAMIIIFGGIALVTLFVLSNYKGTGNNGEGIIAVGAVQIWGTLPQDSIDLVLRNLKEANESYRSVSYRYISPEDFDDVLVNALADQTGPDLILTSHEKLVANRARIQPISYENFSVPDIRSFYIDGAHIFALSDGLYAYPIAVDPLMMYWNRDMLVSAGVLKAPETWESLVNDAFPKLIIRDFDRTITRSVVAMGEYDNVRNSFGVISTLLFQGGTKGVLEDGRDYVVSLHVSEGGGANPLLATASFYTGFSKPSNSLYSWNRSFTDDRQEFLAEDLAFYFGYGSEGRQLEKQNPNLNFDIAEVPQGAAATVRRTYGKFYGLSVLKTADNKSGAGFVLSKLGSAATAKEIADLTNTAPVHVSALSAGSNDTYGRYFYKSAAVARGWLNPDLSSANSVFSIMTKDINENRRDVSQATSDAVSRLTDEY